MKNEDKQLLLKDLCARLPYGVKGRYCLYDSKGNLIDWGNEPEIVENIDLQREKIWTDDTIQGYNIEEQDFKPYLRPMSSMTKDEYAELRKMTITSPNLETAVVLFWNHHYDEKPNWRNDWSLCALSKVLDYLNEHHFDYRGLIEKGLALEAKEGMYK